MPDGYGLRSLIVPVFRAGDLVRVRSELSGMPALSEGVVLQAGVKQSEILVSFWDGGPLRVPLGAVELVERPEPWSEDARD